LTTTDVDAEAQDAALWREAVDSALAQDHAVLAHTRRDFGRSPGYPTTRRSRSVGGRPNLLEAVVLVGALAVGVVQRLELMRGPLGYIDLDEATAGIAAREFFTNPSVFFPSQPYGGTPETFLVGVVHALFGTGQVQLKIIPILLHLGACGFVWGAARRVVPSRAGQLAAPILLWLGPAAGVWESTKERGFYGAAIFVAAAIVWLVARIEHRPTRRDLIAFGLLAGAGWWISPLLLLVVFPATAWLLSREPTRLDDWKLVLPAAVLGALPWIGWNAVNSFESMRQPPTLGTDLFSRFGDGVGKLAVLIGVETAWDADRALVPMARFVAVGIVLAALVVCFVRHPSTGASLSGVLVVGYLLMYPLANNVGSVGADPRYLYPMAPALALLLANLVPTGRWFPAPLGAAAVAAVVVATTSWGITGMEQARGTDARFLEAAGTDDVIDLLRERGVDIATTDLAGTQITYATAGEVRASSFAVPRFAELECLMSVEEPSTYVLDNHLASNVRNLEWYLATEEIDYEKRVVGAWTVVFVDEWVPPWEAGLGMLLGVVSPPEC